MRKEYDWEEVMRQRTAEAVRRQERRERVKTLQDKQLTIRYVHAQPVYLLFNPWHHSTYVPVLPSLGL